MISLLARVTVSVVGGAVVVRVTMAVGILAGVVVTGVESIYLIPLAKVDCLVGTIVLIIT